MRVRVPTLVVLVLFASSAGSLTIASLALADLFWGWGVFFFYTVPAIFFLGWTVREVAPTTWSHLRGPSPFFSRSRCHEVVPECLAHGRIR